MKRKRKKIHITTIRDKKGAITMDPTNIEKVRSGCYAIDIKPHLPTPRNFMFTKNLLMKVCK